MMTDVFKNGQFRMWRSGHLAEIVEEHFKNTLETGTSAGATGDSLRRGTEKEMFGIKGHEAVEGEKYGYVGHDDDLEAFQSNIARGYGRRGGGDGVLYKFKKSAVQDRTTYTAGDSLDSSPQGRSRPLAGYAGEHPTYEGVSALWKNELDMVREAYREYQSGKMTFSEFLEKFSNTCQDGYIECHYHDMLTINDVESITTTRSQLLKMFRELDEERRKRILTKIKSNGIILQVASRRGKTIEDGYAILKEELGLE